MFNTFLIHQEAKQNKNNNSNNDPNDDYGSSSSKASYVQNHQKISFSLRFSCFAKSFHITIKFFFSTPISVH
jgi:hypothetical protein